MYVQSDYTPYPNDPMTYTEVIYPVNVHQLCHSETGEVLADDITEPEQMYIAVTQLALQGLSSKDGPCKILPPSYDKD